MVFVTVGNAKQGFHRLLNAVDKLAGENFFNGEEVFLQLGHTDLSPGYCQFKSFLPEHEFDEYLKSASIVICHGGCTQIQTIQMGKVPVVMPRRKKYGEHVNDHQVQLVEALASEGRVIPAFEPGDLPGAIERARRVNVQGIMPPHSQMIKLVGEAIQELLNGRPVLEGFN